MLFKPSASFEIIVQSTKENLITHINYQAEGMVIDITQAEIQ